MTPRVTKSAIRRALTKAKLRAFLLATPKRKATKGSACRCPIALCVESAFMSDVTVLAGHVVIAVVGSSRVEVPTPTWASKFMIAFDVGKGIFPKRSALSFARAAKILEAIR